MSAAVILRGQRFGRLLVIKQAGKRADRHVLWRCQCVCGRFTNVFATNLRTGKTKSCGCFRIDQGRAHALTHGAAGQDRWPEYCAWTAMKARCLNPKDQKYKLYGARGISVCERWLDGFENFITDMGRKPGSEYSIDRIDNDGNYEPDNCRWATRSQQMSNQQRQKRQQIRTSPDTGGTHA